MNTIRPYPLYDGNNAYLANLGNTVNSHNVHAGKGIKISKNGDGVTIHSQHPNIKENLTYVGVYDPDAEYNVNDVVFVDPNTSYDTSKWGSIGINYGQYVCVNYVPGGNNDSSVFTGTVVPVMASYGGTATNDMASCYRWMAYNVYAPFYPTIPSNYVTTVLDTSGFTITANQTYWQPLMPMVQSSWCVNNQTVNGWVGGVVSGSFDVTKLPYSSSLG